MMTQTLQEKCADVILDALGEKPDLIQQLVGYRAIDRLEKVIRKEERRSAEILIKNRAATEIGILVPAMIQDIITNGLAPATMHRRLPSADRRLTSSTIVRRYPDADPDLVERAWVIARQAIEVFGH
jgi:hypothetical protein